MEHNIAHEHRDDFGDKLGMWIFIFTELLLFAGLFLVYAVYRAKYNEDFHIASYQLNVLLGAFNTIVLLISSMTIAMSITAVQKGNNKFALRLIMLTLVLAILFLINKYFEWGGKISHQLFPGSDVVMGLKSGQALYFGLYYLMTGLHALHIVVGVVLIAIIATKVKSGKINSTDYVFLENGALYWHLVDLIWIFLFPLLYLIA